MKYSIFIFVFILLAAGIIFSLRKDKELPTDNEVITSLQSPGIIEEDTSSKEESASDVEKDTYLDDSRWQWSELIYRNGDNRYYIGVDTFDNRYVMCNFTPLLESSILGFDSISEGKYRFTVIDRCVDIDFNKKNDMYRLASLYPSPKDFKVFDHLYQKDFQANGFDVKNSYKLHFEYPDSTVCTNALKHWIMDAISSVPYFEENVALQDIKSYPYSGDLNNTKAIGKRLANLYFSNTDSACCTQYDKSIHDFRIVAVDHGVVTYQIYISQYSGGAHDTYSEQLISYDTKKDKAIDNKMLFKPNTLNKIKSTLCEATVNDDYYRKCNSHIIENSGIEKAKEYVMESLDKRMPRASISKGGVIFSFQPYEIGCFADGCFHIFVPYAKIKTYLNDDAHAYFK